METEYNAREAREILEPCGVLGEYLLLDDRGVWPAVERDMTKQHETELLRWRPARMLQGEPGAMQVIDTPMLPVPFTARQLAAFMLYGMGAQVADFYGDWEDGPDRESLEHIDPDSGARRAVVDAFAAYRLALGVVGDMDANAQTRLDAASEAYRADHTNKLRAGERRKAHADFNAVHMTWVAEMVRCLLLPESAPASDAGQAAPVAEPEQTPWHLLATPDELIAAFGLHTGMDKSWFANAKDAPQLLDARHTAGKPGRKGTKPLYRVLPVMQWLLDPKRRKGELFEQPDTAWRILKNKFPKVYEEFQDQAPDPD